MLARHGLAGWHAGAAFALVRQPYHGVSAAPKSERVYRSRRTRANLRVGPRAWQAAKKIAVWPEPGSLRASIEGSAQADP